MALYDQPQVLPLPDMYGKNLTFKTGGVDGCDCEEVLRLIEAGKIDTTPLITHRFPLSEIEESYRIFENKLDGVIKVAIIKLEEIMHLPKIDNSTKEERQAYVIDAWKCLHDKGDDMDESEVIQAINHHAFTIQ